MPSSAPRAGAAEVYSANVVGYTKVSLTTGLTQFGLQFQDVGAIDGSLSFKNGIKSSGLMGFDWQGTFAEVDFLSLWDPDSQSYSATYFWSATDDFSIVGEENVWIDTSYIPVNVSLPVGSSLFLNTVSSEANVIISGEVAIEPVTFELKPGLTQFSNPYPVAIPLNAIAFSGLTGFDWAGTFAEVDFISVWDPISQAYSFTYFWSATDDFSIVGSENVWIDTGYTVTDFTIPVGGSVFLFHDGSNSASATFTPPNLD